MAPVYLWFVRSANLPDHGNIKQFLYLVSSPCLYAESFEVSTWMTEDTGMNTCISTKISFVTSVLRTIRYAQLWMNIHNDHVWDAAMVSNCDFFVIFQMAIL